jgi:hypothetical protein
MGRRGRDRMVVGFTNTYAISAITTTVVSSNPAHDEVYSIQFYQLYIIVRNITFFAYETKSVIYLFC